MCVCVCVCVCVCTLVKSVCVFVSSYYYMCLLSFF